MPLFTVGGFSVIEGVLHECRQGVWHADVIVDSPGQTSFSGQVALSLAGLSFRGTWGLNGSTARDSVRGRIVGGAGGLPIVLPAKSYRNATLGLVLNDLLNSVGETLAGSVDPGILSTLLPFWVRTSASAGICLASIAQIGGWNWRTMRDGTIWVGTDTFPASTQSDFIGLKYEPEMARQEYASDNPTAQPGQTLNGKKVSRVVHRVLPDKYRLQLFYE